MRFKHFIYFIASDCFKSETVLFLRQAAHCLSRCLREISSVALITMTKLLEWLFAVSVVVAAWALVTFDLLDLSLPQTYREVAWPMPLYLLVSFGCYSLATVGYRVATFNDCEEAAKELQGQIAEAKEDLRKKGLKM
ncbi:dolichol-phosphate mannosyltransferase subunit 3 isoform X1 [Thunnus albacares]|uniref:dolichol-phosphate mannosyltransferase subunit 3 isoform X1 n=1 Tax=Thunnus albacares TaxID=8236 RepID=UPI001CF7019F|nr:dolichol-phosphate mannosyltransferase subunit 3 isoform X1 [Thunnus albacares]